MAIQLEYGAIAWCTEIIPHTIHTHLGITAVATQDKIVPVAIVDATSRGAHLGGARAQIQVYIDVTIQQFDGNQNGLQSEAKQMQNQIWKLIWRSWTYVFSAWLLGAGGQNYDAIGFFGAEFEAD